MAEKKIQENPMPSMEQPETDTPELKTTTKEPDTPSTPVMADKTTTPDKPVVPPTSVPKVTMQDKTTVPVPVTPVAPRFSMPMFTKASPNDLYRRLLPAMLFVLTFVTVMTMLLIYMDTVALGAQKFRANMSRDYELASIAQGSAALVAYVQQLHLAPRHAAPPHADPPEPTHQVEIMDRFYGEVYNGTFVEFLARGPREATTEYLELSRGWDGVVVRAAARDYLSLRSAPRALHACLSPTAHPREVSYQETDSPEAVFRSRVLCLPLLTVLLAADAARARYVLLGAHNALPALTHLPFEDPRINLQMIEVQYTNSTIRDKTTEFLQTKNYTVAAKFEDSVMYALKEV